MSRPKIIFTPTYEESLSGIEDFIYRSSQDQDALEAFADEHDRVLTFISENPTTPAVHPATGDQSWPFGEGRYRLFFKYLSRGKEKLIYLIHLIDNRQANIAIYPGNKMPNFDEP
jgi:hypothetical protein